MVPINVTNPISSIQRQGCGMTQSPTDVDSFEENKNSILFHGDDFIFILFNGFSGWGRI